jgi:hypothetical protein
MSQYAIEVAGPHNDNLIFSPLQQKLRGRWDMAKVSHRDKTEGMKMLALAVSVIPGQVVALNVDKSIGRIVDPLNDKDGKAILDKCNGVFAQYREVFGGQHDPHPDTTHNLNVDQVKTWLYAMRRLVDSGLAVPVSGGNPLPELDQIRAMPGRRRADPNYTGQHILTEPDDGKSAYGLYPWADEVAEKPGRKRTESLSAAGEPAAT